jgi:3-hydroxyisobutyrate dehydrogenase-like beta-hydroxyacid dehydrogenase
MFGSSYRITDKRLKTENEVTSDKNAATVLGAGLMGGALVRCLLSRGLKVTVWNRSPEKAVALEAHGAKAAASIDEALSASDLIVVCLAGYHALRAALRPAKAGRLQGRTVVQFSSGNPEEAHQTYTWAEMRGAKYLVEGAIMAYPRQVGDPRSPILVSGPEAAYEEVRGHLSNFGKLFYLGEAISAANAHDNALLSYNYGRVFAYFQALAFLMAEGVGVEGFGRLVGDFQPVVQDSIELSEAAILKGDYGGAEATLSTHLAARPLRSRAVTAPTSLRCKTISTISSGRWMRAMVTRSWPRCSRPFERLTCRPLARPSKHRKQ